jgi:hypothetical protein
VRRKDIIIEVQSTLHSGGWQVAKEIVALAEAPAGTFRKVFRGIARRPMSQAEAKRLVDAACKRIELTDTLD